MAKLIIKRKLRRTIIVWYTFHFFAFFTILIGADKSFSWKTKSFNTATDKRPCAQTTKYVYLFTTNPAGVIFDSQAFSSGKLELEVINSGFWPFVTYYDKFKSSDEIIQNGTRSATVCTKTFYGIFNQYNLTEFLFYLLIPIILIIIKKQW